MTESRASGPEVHGCFCDSFRSLVLRADRIPLTVFPQVSGVTVAQRLLDARSALGPACSRAENLVCDACRFVFVFSCAPESSGFDVFEWLTRSLGDSIWEFATLFLSASGSHHCCLLLLDRLTPCSVSQAFSFLFAANDRIDFRQAWVWPVPFALSPDDPWSRLFERLVKMSGQSVASFSSSGDVILRLGEQACCCVARSDVVLRCQGML